MSDSPRTDVLLVFVVWAAGLGAAAQFAKVSVIYETLGEIYASSGLAAVGFMVSVVGLVGLFLGTTAGLLVEGWGYRRVLVAALALAAVLSTFEALLPPYPVMMALRAVEGLSHLAVVVIGPTLIAQATAPRHQGMAMTLWSSFFALSFALTAWLARPLVMGYGVPVLFLAHAAYMAAFALILWRMLPPDAPHGSVPRLRARELLGQHVAIYRSASIAAPAMGFMFYTLMYVALLTLLPPMIGGEHQTLIAFSMPLLSIAVSLTLGVWLLRWLSAVTVVEIGFGVACAAGAVLWLGWGGGLLPIAAAMVLVGSLGLVQGASFAAIPQLNATGGDRVRAAGAVAQLGNLGTTSGTPLLAALIAEAGINGVLVFTVPVCAAGIAVHLWLHGRRARAQLAG